jgi:hypothetical protein
VAAGIATDVGGVVMRLGSVGKNEDYWYGIFSLSIYYRKKNGK